METRGRIIIGTTIHGNMCRTKFNQETNIVTPITRKAQAVNLGLVIARPHERRIFLTNNIHRPAIVKLVATLNTPGARVATQAVGIGP